ncbi:hypothetical protein HHL17_09335 [Chitinophaga sp. G-6-1-13]|uniref:Uncharacterized protein n=1 Tax=Chitinophaga fulva TaxID=2728842 RepID=A0A848GN74_9BACT|nr:hypothetical protein [Chitinophaga fulva]NML37398.1 hypothetical protein [Chitinophaga fulva]
MKRVLLAIAFQFFIVLTVAAQQPIEYGPVQIFGNNEGAAVIYSGNGWQPVTRTNYDYPEALFDQPIPAGWVREYYIGVKKGDNFPHCGSVQLRFWFQWGKAAGHQFEITTSWGVPGESRYQWRRVPTVTDQIALAHPLDNVGYWRLEARIAGCTDYPKPTYRQYIQGVYVKAVDRPAAASAAIPVVLNTDPVAAVIPRYIVGGIDSPISIDDLNGNVGIGTMYPKSKLAVNGDIFAKRVRVTQNAADWPDYVFHPAYQLLSLDSTAAFINANRHLPGIPSAQQINENGLDLGEMNRLLLQKVEELTLHMIEAQAENKALKARVEQLEKGQASPEKQKSKKR